MSNDLSILKRELIGIGEQEAGVCFSEVIASVADRLLSPSLDHVLYIIRYWGFGDRCLR